MLFKRLFNWIKFKTLPSSVLFKNRLFIERDSKHRRVMSNFGLTYRNSKWSDYALTNVSMKSKTSFLRSLQQIILVLFVLFILIRGFKFYNDDLVNNEISFFLWSLLDATKYGLCFLVWSVLFFIKSSFTFLYQRLFSFFYKVESNYDYSTVGSDPVEVTNLPKGSQKLVFYSWLTSNSRGSRPDSALENLYSPVNTNNWATGSNFFKSLYQTANSIKLSESVLDHSTLSNLVQKNSHTTGLLLNSSSLQKVVTLQSDLNTIPASSLRHLTLNSLNNRTKWNMYSIESEIDKYNPYIKSIKGLFYIYDTNFNKLSNLATNNPELTSLMNSVTDQNKMFKWNRWLYRYNILHRKVMKNAHKTTLAKKLISTGFLDSSLMDRNLWASDFFSNQKKSTRLLATNFNNLYGATLGLTNNNQQTFTTLNSFSTANTLNMLDTYEDSYFYFLKRFYMFNTLVTNKINSSVRLENITNGRLSENTAVTENLINHHQNIIANLIKSNKLTNQHLDPSNVFEINPGILSMNSSSTYKDLLTVNTDYDLMNLDNLEIMSNLSSSLTSNNYQFNYFNTLTYQPQTVTLDLSFNSNISSDNVKFTPYYQTSDSVLLTDIFTLSHLIK